MFESTSKWTPTKIISSIEWSIIKGPFERLHCSPISVRFILDWAFISWTRMFILDFENIEPVWTGGFADYPSLYLHPLLILLLRFTFNRRHRTEWNLSFLIILDQFASEVLSVVAAVAAFVDVLAEDIPCPGYYGACSRLLILQEIDNPLSFKLLKLFDMSMQSLHCNRL